MGLFSKKKEVKTAGGFDELPELPKLPKTPGMGMPNREITSLPSLPATEGANRWSMQAVKDAVRDEEEMPEEETETMDGMEGWERSRYDNQGTVNQGREMDMMRRYMNPQEVRMPMNNQNTMRTPEIRMDREMQAIPTQNTQRSKEPLFIRIDKFEEAMRNFEMVKEKVQEIEEIIHDIKEIRMKEDQEFQDWEKDLYSIKTKLENIDKSIFNKLD